MRYGFRAGTSTCDSKSYFIDSPIYAVDPAI